MLAAYRSVALIPRKRTGRMGERRREPADRQPLRTPQSGDTLRVVPAARRRGAAVSPASAAPSGGSTHDRRIGPLDLCSGLAWAAVECISRKAAHWSARRAMRRLRRHPAPVAARARSARSVLIVCHGNIIRSPFAARLVQQAVSGRRSLAVASAGLEAVPGQPAHPMAVQMASARQIDLAGHASSRITPELVASKRSDPRHGHPSARHAPAALSRGRPAHVPPDVPRARHAARGCRSCQRQRRRVPSLLRAHHPRHESADPRAIRDSCISESRLRHRRP